MLHDPSKVIAVGHGQAFATVAAALGTEALPTGQRLRPVKVIDRDYEKYCNELLNGVWQYRAPHANRPTPPKRKWAWALQVAPA